MKTARILPDSIHQADGGFVEYTVETAVGPVRGVIENTFFEDFMGQPQPQLTAQRKAQIALENLAYFEAEAARQLREGKREIIIK